MKKNYFILAMIAVMLMFIGCDTEGSDSKDDEQPSAAPQQTQPQQPQPQPQLSIHYTVKFDNNGGTGTMSDLTADGGQNITLPTCIFTAPPYMRFNYWNTDQNDGNSSTRYNDGAKVKDLTTDDGAAVTLYAIWMEKESHSIQYLNAKGTNSNVTSFKESDDIELEDLSADGYTFDGWFEVVDDATSDTRINGWAAGDMTADITLWAKWTPHTYTIKFDKNGGEGTMDNLPMTYDVSKDLTANTFTKDGWLFVGWALSADGEMVYTNEQEVKDLTADNGAEVTLYAIWKEKSSISVGDIMYSDMTFSSEYVAGKTPIGIVFEVGTKVKIVHLSEQSSLKWCLNTADGYNCNFATSKSDGSGNWQIICDAVSDEDVAGNYPAFEYVNGLGSGWYLPAKDELNAVYTNKADINAALTKLINAEVSAIPLGTDHYWSSSSYTDNYAWPQRFSDGFQGIYGKGGTYSVRAVRAF